MKATCHPLRKAQAKGLCATCYNREWTARNAKRAKAYRLKHRASEQGILSRRRYDYKRLYGITPEQYDRLLEWQGGVCGVCGNPPKKVRLAIDHDHKTKKIRGLLCSYCNHRLIGRHTIEKIRKALQYLERAGEVDSVLQDEAANGRLPTIGQTPRRLP